jgi:hypothetical protein
VLEIDDRVAGPKLLAQVFTRHQRARLFDQHAQNAQRLALELELHPAPAQLKRTPIKFKGIEPKEMRSCVTRVSHGKPR